MYLQNCPPNLLTSLREIRFICPQCRGQLQVLENGYECEKCKKIYSLHDGIPDFRVLPDPFLNYEEDYKRTEIILSKLHSLKFEKLLEYYWSYSEITPIPLRRKFVLSALMGNQRASQTLKIISAEAKKPIKRVLEIGSGTGNFLAAASSSNYETVIGIDVAMRWLHVSRRRFMDANIETLPMVCCNAEFLPFADDSFDLIVASSTLEFVNNQESFFAECYRTLNQNGTLYLNTINRFSINKNPYVNLWGVGFLPQNWQSLYVKWRCGAHYGNVKTLSYKKLNSITRKWFPTKKIILPDIETSAIKQFSFGTRLQIKIYRLLKQLPGSAFILNRIGPGWDVILRKYPIVKK